MSLVRVIALTKPKKACIPSSSYEYAYDGSTCIGEVIRNVCVNLSIDPDTADGITRNVKVFRNTTSNSGTCSSSSRSSSDDKKMEEEQGGEEEWHYDPWQDLQEACNINTGTLSLLVEEVRKGKEE